MPTFQDDPHVSLCDCRECCISDATNREERAYLVLSIVGAAAFVTVALAGFRAVIQSGLFSWIGR